MAANSRRTSGKTAVSLPVLIAAIVVFVLFLGGLGWYFLVPATDGAPARALTSEEQANVDWVKQKAKESGGDFDKLSQEDKRRLLSIKGPMGPFELRQEAHNLHSGQ